MNGKYLILCAALFLNDLQRIPKVHYVKKIRFKNQIMSLLPTAQCIQAEKLDETNEIVFSLSVSLTKSFIPRLKTIFCIFIGILMFINMFRFKKITMNS